MKKKTDATTHWILTILVSVISVCIVTLITIFSWFVYSSTVGANKTKHYFDSIEGLENHDNFFHCSYSENAIFVNGEVIVDPLLKNPYAYNSSQNSKHFDYNYFGATNEELFYFVETDEGIDFYKSNYTNYTCELTRSFNSDEILYHKCDKLIYLGKDGETYIFDGFDLTDEVYEGEIPTYTPRYTVTAEKKDFVIKDNETGEEKRISDLKKTFRQNEHIKKLGVLSTIPYVFTHDNDIYILYDGTFTMATVIFKFDFETNSIVPVNWCVRMPYIKGDETWYLDRVKFEE